MRVIGLFVVLTGLAFAGPRDIEHPFPTKWHMQRLEREGTRKMAATIRWISADGDWTAGGSWSGGSAPTTVDTALFDGISQRSVTLNQANAADFANLITTEEYSGSIGTNGNPLICDISNRVTLHGSGSVYHEKESSDVTTGPFFTIDSPNNDVALYYNNPTNVGSIVLVKAGHVQIGAAAKGRFYVIPSGSQPAVLESVAEGGAQFRLLINRGGIILGRWAQSSDNGNSMNNHSGTMALTGLDMALLKGDAEVHGGTLSIGPNPSGSQSLNRLRIYGGVVDFSRLSQAYSITVLELFGGDIVRSDLLTVVTEYDWRKPYPDF